MRKPSKSHAPYNMASFKILSPPFITWIQLQAVIPWHLAADQQDQQITGPNDTSPCQEIHLCKKNASSRRPYKDIEYV